MDSHILHLTDTSVVNSETYMNSNLKPYMNKLFANKIFPVSVKSD